VVASTCPLPRDLQAAFLTDLLPKIESHARVFFRHIRCDDQRADKIAESVAVAWQWYRRLAERGKDVNQFLITFIRLAARAVRSGRRLCGMERAKDVLSPRAQRRHGFRAEPLPQSTRRSHDCLHSLIRGLATKRSWRCRHRCRAAALNSPPGRRSRRSALFLSVGRHFKLISH